jgi:hypothetical protein
LTDPNPFDLLAAALIVRPAHVMRPDRHLGLELGDQTGILDPALTEPLAAAVRKRLPAGVAGIAVGSGVVEILLGYLVTCELGIPLASITNVDGRIEVGGRFPASGPVALVTTILEQEATLAEFEAACGRASCAPAGAVALVDRLPRPDPRVSALLRWADHEYEPSACPLCRSES